MVTVEFTGVDPVGVTDDGAAEQVAIAGKPEHARVTTEVKPVAEVTPTVMFVLFPATTVPEAGLIAMAKFEPPPVREITWGLLGALSIKVTVPRALPAVVGV
jgi:hypothetical protein